MNITCCRHVYVRGGDPVVVGGGSWRPTGATRDVPLHVAVVALNPYAALESKSRGGRKGRTECVCLLGGCRAGWDRCGGGVKRTNERRRRWRRYIDNEIIIISIMRARALFIDIRRRRAPTHYALSGTGRVWGDWRMRALLKRNLMI